MKKMLRALLLLVLVALAMGVRLWVIRTHAFVFDDSRDYISLAQAIMEQRAYQVNGLCASRMPGYPVFLAAILFAWHSIRAVLTVQAVLAGFCVVFVYFLGRRISPAAGFLAAALFAVDPFQVGFTAAVLSELPFTLIFLAALCVLLRLADRDHGLCWAFLGGLWGVMVYLRASAFWLMIPLGLWVMAVHVWRARRAEQPLWVPVVRGICGIALAFALLSLVLLPWNARNTARFGRHTWLTTLEGISLYEAVYPQADGGPRQDQIQLPEEMMQMGEAARNSEWMRRARQEIRDNPARVFRLAFTKIARTWSPWLNAADYAGPQRQSMLTLWSMALYVLAVIGLWSRRLPWPLRGVLLICLLYFTALHAIFLGSVRYRVPLMPLLHLLAAVGVVTLIRWLWHPSRPTTAPISGLQKDSAV